MPRPRTARVLALFAAGAALARPAESDASTHPHDRLPLRVYSDRTSAFLGGARGTALAAAVERRLSAARPPDLPTFEPGAAAATLRKWAARGQVDLVEQVLRRFGDEAAAPADDAARARVCETTRALLYDAARGDPPAIAALPEGRVRVLPTTARAFLSAPRPGLARPAPLPPADVAFLDDLRRLDATVRRACGYERLDLDDDGTAESERADFDDDGVFELVRVDRDGDDRYELEAERGKGGAWTVRKVAGEPEAARRAEYAPAPAASRPAAEASRPTSGPASRAVRDG